MAEPKKTYGAFLSYTHREPDRTVARKLQTGLQRLNASWWKPWSIRVFRDETDLAASPEGWEKYQECLAAIGISDIHCLSKLRAVNLGKEGTPLLVERWGRMILHKRN